MADNRPFPLPLLPALWIAMVSALLMCGCREVKAAYGDPLVHNGVSDIWPDSIDLHNGVMLCARGDSLLQLRVEGNVMRNIPVGAPQPGRFIFRSDFPLFDALLRLEAAREDLHRGGVMAPYELWLDPLPASETVRELETRLRNDLVVPAEGRRYGWPVVNENPMWLLAACEAFKAGGSRRWLELVAEVAANVAYEDHEVRYDRRDGLFTGIPIYMAGNNAPFPGWMEPADVMAVRTLAVNGAWWSALNAMRTLASEMMMKNDNARLPELPFDPDSLLHSINRELWLPGRGCYSALAYGNLFCPLQLQSSDNLAQGLAILTGMTSPAMTARIIETTPVGFQGVELYTPAINGLREYEPVARAIWCAATARSGNDAAYDMAFGTILDATATALLRGDRAGEYSCRNVMSGIVLRGILGVSFSFDCMRFSPAVPKGMTGTKRIEGLRYRRSRLDIEIEGTGSEPVAFEIDGKPSEPVFPSSAEGNHTIRIVLREKGEPGRVTTGDGGMLPPPPEAEWTTPRRATVLSGIPSVRHGSGEDKEERGIRRENEGRADMPGKSECGVYLDGVPAAELTSHSYEIPDTDAPVEVQFVNTAGDNLTGYSSAPHLFVPQGRRHLIYLPEVVKGGTKVIQDKKLAARFVESDRRINRNIRFSFNAPEAGEYLIDVHYASGLGIVNRKRRTALRSLWIDGERRGVFVFPQMTASTFGHNENTADWQRLTSFSNTLRVNLRKGENLMMLKLYQPSPVYVDPTSNSVVADFVRIIRLGNTDTSAVSDYDRLAAGATKIKEK